MKFNFSRVKVSVVVGYGLNQGDDEERDRTLDSVGNGYRLCILGVLNG